MTDNLKIRVKRTPNGRHPYTANARGFATYGWGHTSAEARQKLIDNIEASGEQQAVGRYRHEADAEPVVSACEDVQSQCAPGAPEPAVPEPSAAEISEITGETSTPPQRRRPA